MAILNVARLRRLLRRQRDRELSLGGLLALPGEGVVADVSVAVAWDGASVSWRSRGLGEPCLRHVVGIDGEAVAVVGAGETRAEILIPEGAGEHAVEVVSLRPEARRIAEVAGLDPYGDRVQVRWPAATAADVRGYVVSLGGVVAATIRDVVISDVSQDVRVTWLGEWDGESCNRVVQVRVTSTGFETDHSGAWVAVEDFEAGDEFELVDGLRVRWEVGRGEFDPGDTFAARVGPATRWTSGALEPGSYAVSVVAFDAAGNTSPALTTSVVVWGRAPGVEGLAATWDGSEIELRWNQVEGAGEVCGDIDVYANWSPAMARLIEAINFDAPIATVAADWGETEWAWQYEPPVDGVWRFVVRPRHASHGGHNLSVEEAEVDTRGLASGIELREPEGVTARAGAGGSIVVSWRYPIAEGGDINSFRVYAHAADPPSSWTTPAATVIARDAPAPVEAYEATLAGPYTGTRYVAVRARDASGNETTNTAVVAVVCDATGPTMSGSVWGGPV